MRWLSLLLVVVLAGAAAGPLLAAQRKCGEMACCKNRAAAASCCPERAPLSLRACAPAGSEIAFVSPAILGQPTVATLMAREELPRRNGQTLLPHPARDLRTPPPRA